MKKKNNPLFTLWLSSKKKLNTKLCTQTVSLYQSTMHTASAHLETPAHGLSRGGVQAIPENDPKISVVNIRPKRWPTDPDSDYNKQF